jgi:hypothetical protein
MIIVIDTTETFEDLHLAGAQWKLLKDFLDREPAVLVVPEVVVEETINHFREKLTESVRNRESAGRLIAQLTGGEPMKEPPFDLEAAVKAYRNKLLNTLKRLSAQMPLMKTLQVPALVARALRRDPPFDSCGQRGFRDAVLWESLLQYLQSDQGQTYLVTRNTRDFGDQAGLHPTLKRDLDRLGLPVGIVEVSPGMKHLIEKHLRPKLTLLKEIQSSIQEGTFDRCDAWSLFLEEKYSITMAVERSVRSRGFRGIRFRNNLRDPQLASLDNLHNLEVSDVYRLKNGDLLVPIAYETSGRIEFVQEYNRGWDEIPEERQEEGEADFTIYASILIPADPSEDLSLDVDEVDFSLPHYP